MGAVAATVVSISFVVMSHIHYAKRLSRVDFADMKFGISLTMILLTYVVVYALEPVLSVKVAIFAISIVLIYRIFDMQEYIRVFFRHMANLLGKFLGKKPVVGNGGI